MTDIAEHEATKLTQKQQQKLRAQLQEDHVQTEGFLSRLREDVDSLRESRNDVTTDDEHDPEGPTLAFERSQAGALVDDTAKHLAGIEAALLRLDDGTFGFCAMCGESIPFARLEARPYTVYCVECSDRAARRG